MVSEIYIENICNAFITLTGICILLSMMYIILIADMNSFYHCDYEADICRRIQNTIEESIIIRKNQTIC